MHDAGAPCCRTFHKCEINFKMLELISVDRFQLAHVFRLVTPLRFTSLRVWQDRRNSLRTMNVN